MMEKVHSVPTTVVAGEGAAATSEVQVGKLLVKSIEYHIIIFFI